jgi:hypothetical protein
VRTLSIKSDAKVNKFVGLSDLSEVFIVAIMQKFSSRVASTEILARA